MKNFYRVTLLVAFALASSMNVLMAQQVDYKYHSVFMYNFTRYVKWPDNSLGSEFVIGVLGKSDIIPHLEKMAETKNVGGKPIVVKVYESPAEVSNCQMLFLPERSSKYLAEIREAVASKPTLIVSEKPGLGKNGSDINFIINDGRWSFELNQASTDMHKLKVSSELTKFAHKIYTEI